MSQTRVASGTVLNAPSGAPSFDTLGIGGHVALDLLNTVVRADDHIVDLLDSDQKVLAWLAKAGQPVPQAAHKALRSGALLRTARELRETIREAILRRKAGKRVQVHALNAFLAKGASYLSLAPQQDGTLALDRVWHSDTPEQLLTPIAEAAADLLANGDFDLIRKCESEQCVLWFYDRTKSHHRRWCSVSACGNRSKVAAFRQRQAAAKQA